MISGFHHTGHLTNEYERTTDYYCDALGGTVAEMTEVGGAIRVSFITWQEFTIEVVGREDRGTYLDELLDALLDVSPYHLALTVPAIEEAMATLQREGYPTFNSEPIEGLGPYVRAFVEPDATPGMPLELIDIRG